MQIITAKDERAQITANGWIIGHNKASGHDYADPNVERSRLFVIGTTVSTAHAYVSAVLSKGSCTERITFLGIESTCDWEERPNNGLILITPDVGYANDKVQRHVYELLASIEGNADEHQFTVLLPSTMDMHDFLERLMEYTALHGDVFRSSRLSVQPKGDKDIQKRTSEDTSVLTFRDYAILYQKAQSPRDFIPDGADWPSEIYVSRDMALLSGEELFRVAVDLSACTNVLLSYPVWERIYTHMNYDLSRFQKPKARTPYSTKPRTI